MSTHTHISAINTLGPRLPPSPQHITLTHFVSSPQEASKPKIAHGWLTRLQGCTIAMPSEVGDMILHIAINIHWNLIWWNNWHDGAPLRIPSSHLVSVWDRFFVNVFMVLESDNNNNNNSNNNNIDMVLSGIGVVNKGRCRGSTRSDSLGDTCWLPVYEINTHNLSLITERREWTGDENKSCSNKGQGSNSLKVLCNSTNSRSRNNAMIDKE